MKKYSFLIVLLSALLHSQTITVESDNELLPLRWVILQKLEGGEMFFIRSLDSVKEGKAQLELNGLPYGEYAIQYDTEHVPGLRFIHSGEDIHIRFNPEKPALPYILRSRTNKAYYDFQRYNRKIIRKLRSFKRRYQDQPSDKLQKAYQQFKIRYEQHVDSLLKTHQNRRVWHFIKGKKEVLPDSLKPSRQAYIDYAVKHYFDEIDLNDSVLYHSHVLYDRLEEYLFKIPIQAYGKEKSNRYVNRLKLIFDRMTYLPARASFIKTFMVLFSLEDEQAKKFLEKLYNELPETYKNDLFTRQLEKSKAPVRGQKFDTDYLKQKTGITFKPKTFHLFIFFSSDCPHCQSQLPVLYDYLQKRNYTGLQVSAIGLEENPARWKAFVEDLPAWQHGMVTGNDIMSVALKYFVEFTPTYFITDKNFTILEKTSSSKELYEILNYFFDQ